jgi:hypothetical protein
MASEQKLSSLQRWILIEAYAEIVGAGSSKPKKYRRTICLPPVHLLRIYVLRDYFNIPLRTQKNDYGHKWLVVDNATVGPEKANAARTSLSRSLRRLKERGLISDSICLTLRGIYIAKELSTNDMESLTGPRHKTVAENFRQQLRPKLDRHDDFSVGSFP